MPEQLQIVPVTLEDLKQLSSEQRLYAVLDACDSPAIQAKITDLGSSRVLCLYRGEISPAISEVAPYLARVDHSLLAWMVGAVWNEPWGILIVAKYEPDAIRRHLRKFLMIQDEAGETIYFRYYDPRVLSTFLASCYKNEIDHFFGPITAFGFRAGASGYCLAHRRG